MGGGNGAARSARALPRPGRRRRNPRHKERRPEGGGFHGGKPKNGKSQSGKPQGGATGGEGGPVTRSGQKAPHAETGGFDRRRYTTNR